MSQDKRKPSDAEEANLAIRREQGHAQDDRADQNQKPGSDLRDNEKDFVTGESERGRTEEDALKRGLTRFR